MYDRFTVSVGQTLFVWRQSQVASSVGSWYRGHIQSVSAIPWGNNWDVTAFIRYEDGYCGTIRFSIADGKQVATCVHTGRKIFWRHIDEQNSVKKVGHTSSVAPILPRDEGNAMDNGQSIRNVPQSDAQRPMNITIRETVDSPILRHMEMRVQELERKVFEIQAERTKRYRVDLSPCQSPGIPERVLQQLRGKLELILDRPVQSIVTSEEEKVTIRNDVLKCSVDCALGEYRSLCLTLKRDLFALSTFVPQTFGEESAMAVFAFMTVHFLSFGDACAALGEFEEDRVIRNIMKSRKRRTRSSPSMIRIIGDAFIPVPGTLDPMYITVGSCITEKTINKCKKPLPVIKRQNMSQDEVDMAFIHDLETTTLDAQHAQLIFAFPRKAEGSTAPRKRATGSKKPTKNSVRSFQMRWVPQRSMASSSTFEERSRALKRAGYLEVLIPTVFCYNMSQCEELVSVCTKEFLTACVQRLSSSQ